MHDQLHVSATSAKAPAIIRLIACHRGVTENQASTILGRPSAITSAFGVFAADHVQQVQMIFLAQCADRGAIGVALRRLNEWLRQTGEDSRIFGRATGRRCVIPQHNDSWSNSM